VVRNVAKTLAAQTYWEYTRGPHLPPLFSKVRQAEMEADDCEGRLPPLFSVSGEACLSKRSEVQLLS